MNETKVVIDAEFKGLISPLTETERAGLERDLRREGCRDPLVAWRRENGDVVLLDGHNRYDICRRHNLAYTINMVDLPSRREAMLWLCEHQLNRRNLNETQRAMIGAKIATMKQGARTDLTPNGGMSQAEAAKALKVGERSIQRAQALHSK